MALIAAHLNAGIILVVTVYRQVYNLPLPPPPYLFLSPFSPSLISLMVSVDVKHHVCLLTDVCSSSRCGKGFFSQSASSKGSFTASVHPQCEIVCINICTHVKFPKYWQPYHCLDTNTAHTDRNGYSAALAAAVLYPGKAIPISR